MIVYIKSALLFSFFVMTSLFSTDFVLFTQPKTGTHLLIPILEDLTKRHVYWAKEFAEITPPKEIHLEMLDDPNSIFFSVVCEPWTKKTMDQVWWVNRRQGSFLHLHAPYSSTMESYLSQKKCITFFIKRDPRDQIVSLLNHYKYINYNDKSVALLKSDEEKLFYMIRKHLREETLCFMGWINSPICCALEFDKLMGSSGGTSTDKEAVIELRKMVRALDMNVSDATLRELYKKHFGKGWSFFKGKVGSWKDYFNDELKTLVKEEIGDLLIELGYEKDYNW